MINSFILYFCLLIKKFTSHIHLFIFLFFNGYKHNITINTLKIQNIKLKQKYTVIMLILKK